MARHHLDHIDYLDAANDPRTPGLLGEGLNKAIFALAHTMIVIVWRLWSVEAGQPRVQRVGRDR
jgi:hypothetical protein